MTRTMTRAMTLLVMLLLSSPLAAQDTPLGGNRYRPGLSFKVLSIGRFDVLFHQGEETLANRLAAIIKDAAPPLERRFGEPAGRVRVILVDQNDVSNGWASVVPYNLIEISAAPPTGQGIIGNTDDWLRLVFVHEYTHVLHLVKSGGWFGSLRKVFGRVPLFYPNLFVPDWQIEGLATYQESAATGQGRIPAGDFRTMLRRAAAENRFAPLDRATSAVIDWPGGSSSYLFGAYFHEFLAARYGEETIARLADATARRLPLFGSAAFREVYGKSLGSLWREFAAAAGQEAARDVISERRARLTHHGFTTASPVFSPDGRLFYAAATPHGFPTINELRGDGSVDEVATRYHGARVSAGADVLVFDQFEAADNVALVSDLYARPIGGGRSRRLTEGARAADPDLSPDGRTIVCTVQQAGRRILATLPLTLGGVSMPTALVAADATEFSAPRWSPDGRSIAAERRRLHGPSEIVVIDVATGSVREVVATRSGRNILPTWTPSGDAILFSSDHWGGAFQLYAASLAGEIRRVNGLGRDVREVVFAPDGKRVVFVAYSADGFDLYSSASDGMALSAPVESDAQPQGPTMQALEPAAVEKVPVRNYSPLDTLLPRFWVPYIETDGDDTVIGAGTAGFDALGRHAYSLTAGWATPRNSADLQADYVYSRWRTSLFAAISDEADAWREGHIRTREVTAGALLPIRRVRWAVSLFAAGSASRDRFERSSPEFPLRPDLRRDALRGGIAFSNARTYGYSISAEEGGVASVVTEIATGGPSGEPSGSATSVATSARYYIRTWPRHGVLAVRLAGATSRGDAAVQRTFSAGGSGPPSGPFAIGVDAIGLLRGFEEADLSGTSAAVFNADYRFPLGWPQRGVGTIPVFLRRLHGALFFDIGHAWDERFDADDLRRSAGLELSADGVLLATLPVTVAAGVAWRDDPSGLRTGPVFFARIGRAF